MIYAKYVSMKANKNSFKQLVIIIYVYNVSNKYQSNKMLTNVQFVDNITGIKKLNIKIIIITVMLLLLDLMIVEIIMNEI